jgi:hypothetical protein
VKQKVKNKERQRPKGGKKNIRANKERDGGKENYTKQE